MKEKPKSKANAMTHLATARMTLAASYKMLTRIAARLPRPT